jgi:hypothetical protein
MLFIVQISQGLDGSGESRVRRHILDAPPGVPNFAAIAERADVIRACSNRHENKPPSKA